VVDRTIETGKTKSRAAIYFRDINAAVIPDIYRTPSQAEIIAQLVGRPYITIMDATAMFYQWPVHPDYNGLRG
jgi:hypothetical protein